MPAPARVNKKIIVNKKYKFFLEIYLALKGHEDISWEIFPEDYHSALYAFSNKEKLNKLIRKKYLYEPKTNI